MDRIIVSACLLGHPVRYNGRAKDVDSPHLRRWQAEGRLVAACPELLAGFPVPRPPAEIVGGDGAAVLDRRARVVERGGVDVTAAFVAGAAALVALAEAAGARFAVLTEPSPSCSSREVHDGSFGGSLRPGRGVAAAALVRAGVAVFTLNDLDVLAGLLLDR
jgi:uncharacterized protein YbbK (DUF523 family)